MLRQPTTFYRYRGFSTISLDSVCNDQIYSAHPGTFNDPFDCNPTVDSDSTLEELRNLLSVLLQKRLRSEGIATLGKARIKGARATEYAEKIARSVVQNRLENIAYNATNPDYEVPQPEAESWLLTNEIQEELRLHYERGVCCFSATYRSQLLWSHYGDQHKGLCIGYSPDRLPKPRMQQVEYGGNRLVPTSLLIKAIVFEDTDSKVELDRNMLLRKARGWKYENEWRLVGTPGAAESPLLLKEVTFGLRCPTSVVHAVTQALAGREGAPVHFYKMHMVRDSFRLSRKIVDLSKLSISMPRVAMSGIEMFGDTNDDGATSD